MGGETPGVKSYEEKREFLSGLYEKHADFVKDFRKNHVPELDPELVKMEGGLSPDREDFGNRDWSLRQETIEEALRLTLEQFPDE